MRKPHTIIRILCWVLLLSCAIVSKAQVNPFEQSFKEFDESIKKKHKDFRDSIDLVFAEFMRNNWDSFEGKAGHPVPIDPFKPKDQPIAPDPVPNRAPEEIPYEPAPEEQPDNKVPIPDPVPEKAPIPEEETPIPDPLPDEEKKDFPEEEMEEMQPPPPEFIPEPLPEDKPEEPARFKKVGYNFYGAELPFRYDVKLEFNLEQPFESSIPDAWIYLSQLDYYDLMQQFSLVAKKMQLNDWGYVQIVRKFTEQLFPGAYDKQAMLTCFILNKAGFVAKLSFNAENVFLLIPAQQTVFEKMYLTIGDQQFYVYSFDPNVKPNGRFRSYNGNYRGNDHVVNFAFRQIPLLVKDQSSRQLSFPYEGETHSVTVKYNKTLITYFNDFPSVEMQVHFSSSLSNEALASLKKDLLPLLRGKSQLEKANLLLRFVQKGFEYQTDQDQFGYEKYFFPEELFHYPYADCEDRSALYSTLTRELLGLEIVGLIFPEHAATAVKFTENFDGDYLYYKDDKFTICDPTYIGADIGTCMPQFKEVKADVFTTE